MIVFTGDEAITTRPEVNPLEIPQSTEAYPLEGNQERTSINPSDDVDDVLGPFDEEPTTMEDKYNMVNDVKLILPTRLNLISKSLDDLTSHSADDKRGEKDLPQAAAAVLTTPTDAQDERAKPNEAVAEFVDAIISHEAKVVAEAEDNDDAMKVDAQDEDLPITSADNAGDKEYEDDDDNDEADDPLSFLDAGKDLGAAVDDEDDDNDDFTIQYHTKPFAAQKGVSLRESSSQGEKEKETSTKNQNTSSKDKCIVEEGNLTVLFKPINP
ncbi:RNA polymerase II subunit 5-mediating protein homolog [Cynara cardunculus var. scolymus]|uniref:RNA polymerase II subunit 5-mediating protein homolog n=1 Tax=Cynara cardunculus var. scolymus TaxID=59895 RepID=UPI000D62E8A9|nr:RNA polymerase II subunit 5-mediating protein homolog [Cynara cardunculus var. scolymus]